MNSNKDLFALIGALMVGIISDRVLTKAYIGLGFSLTLVLFTVLFFILYGKVEKFKKKKELLLLFPLFIIIFHNSVYNNPVLFMLNILIIPILIAGIHIIYISEDAPYWRLLFSFELFYQTIIAPFICIPVPLLKLKKLFNIKESTKKIRLKPEIKAGLLLSIPLLFVVIILLNSADMVFGYYISNALDYLNVFKYTNINELFSHLIIICTIVLCVLAYMWSFAARKPVVEYLPSENKLQPAIIAIPVTMLNVIYLFFSLIQFSYLYAKDTLPNGFSYAEYARRGFFELVAVTVINFIIILVGINKSIKANKKMNTYSNILYSLLILFTVNMIYSAHFKLKLYETTYGFTYLRVFVHLFIAFLLIISILGITAIWYTKLNLSKAIIISSVIFYGLINTFNIDGFIAKENINLYSKNNKIDTAYITSLSYDAVPYMLDLQNNSNSELKDTLNSRLYEMKNELSKDNAVLNYNFNKQRAKKLLSDKYFAEINSKNQSISAKDESVTYNRD